MTLMAFLSRAIKSASRRGGAGRRGFTLVESLLAAAVLSILVAGVGELLAASYQQTMVQNQTATAIALGRQLLEEIASKPLTDPATGTTTPAATAKTTARSTFTGVGDYNLYTDNGASLSTLGATTLNVTAGQTYTRAVSVQLGATPSGDSVSPNSDFALVTVTVTTPSGQTVKLQRVVTNYTFTR
jgi:prepilin-type N-terminal cleavage/methylation domain-containing protein